MFRHIFDNVEGINAYSLFSLFVFVIFFIAVTVMMIKADKQHIEEMSRKPLDTNEPN